MTTRAAEVKAVKRSSESGTAPQPTTLFVFNHRPPRPSRMEKHEYDATG
jgi:hypothetical protein